MTMRDFCVRFCDVTCYGMTHHDTSSLFEISILIFGVFGAAQEDLKTCTISLDHGLKFWKAHQLRPGLAFWQAKSHGNGDVLVTSLYNIILRTMDRAVDDHIYHCIFAQIGFSMQFRSL